MPVPVAPAEKRTPLLTVLFWIGVALAPLAALILLVADGDGPLRFGAVLAILSVVLIGLSIALRSDGGGTAGADELRDEIEQLRRELRGEVVAAAQRGNQALDRAQRTEESVTALRRRLDAAAAGIAAAAGLTTGAAEEPAGPARVPAPEPYDDRHDQPDQGGTGWGQPAAHRRGEDDSARRPQPGPRYGTERPVQPGGADRPQAGVYGVPRTPEPDARPEPGPRQVGVVHHTETVHVTTRHTIVDGGADPMAGRYGGRWSPEERGFGGAEPEERPRSGYRDADDHGGRSTVDRGRPAQAVARDDRSRAGRGADPDDRAWTGHDAARDDRSWAGQGVDRDDRPWAGRGTDRDDRSWVGQSAGREDRSWAGQGAGRDDRPWAGQGASGAEWGRPGHGGPRQDGEKSFGGPGAPVPEHARASVADAAHDRGWSAGPGEERSWSPEGRVDEGSWTGPGDSRSWSAGRHEVGRDEVGQAGGWASAYAKAWAPAEPSGPVTDDADSDGDYWSELRSGNRWASVRDDERGREVRVGERRAAVHADGGGTEYRVEDRWAEVREPRRDPGGVYDGVAGETRREQGGVYGAGWAQQSRPALPAGGVPVPDGWRPPTQRSGQAEWRHVDPEPVRYGDERYGHPPRDDAPRAGGTQYADRWR